MTCIVGCVESGKVIIGGDSAGVDGSYNLSVRSDVKVFRNGPMIMGFTSSFRMGQLLRYAFQPPQRHPDTDVYQYMVTTFVDAVRDCLKRGGYARQDAGEESGGFFLVGYAGRLFEIQSDYEVAEVSDGFMAVGCGAPIALGAMYATMGRPGRERITTALCAAERLSAGVRGPYTIEELEV